MTARLTRSDLRVRHLQALTKGELLDIVWELACLADDAAAEHANRDQSWAGLPPLSAEEKREEDRSWCVISPGSILETIEDRVKW